MKNLTIAVFATLLGGMAVLAAPSSVDISIDELPDSDATNKLGINLEFIQCAFYAIEHAVNDTPYQTIWAKYAPALVKTMESFVNCVDLENNHEMLKCYFVELVNFMDALQQFYNELESANATLLQKIRDNIEKECRNIN